MPGKLLAQARRDAQKFVTSGGFEETLTLTTPDAAKTVTVTGLATGRWQSMMNSDGLFVNSNSFHISVPEAVLTALEYPVRSEKSGKVKLAGHLVTFKDNTGTNCKFVVTECYPNATTGLIMCILGESK